MKLAKDSKIKSGDIFFLPCVKLEIWLGGEFKYIDDTLLTRAFLHYQTTQQATQQIIIVILNVYKISTGDIFYDILINGTIMKQGDTFEKLCNVTYVCMMPHFNLNYLSKQESFKHITVGN